jgi:uncharacterized protein YecE (DUF72 family)
MIKVGLCGFTIGAARYFEQFPVVEVQQTFYEPPSTQTMMRWRAEAPPDFEFTMKAWQLITHRATSNTYRRLKTSLTPAQRAEAGAFQNSETVMRAWQKSVDCAKLLRATAILFQCPASFRPDDANIANLRTFFGKIVRPKRVCLLWEPRGAWPDALILDLCRELALTHVVDPFDRDTVTPELTYWRLHGIGNHYHVYTDDELRTLRAKIARAAETYVMFNNIPRVRDAERFRALPPA